MQSLMFKALVFMFIILGSACGQRAQFEDQASQGLNLKQAAIYNTQLGLAYLKQGRRPRAKKKLLQALRQAPESAEVNAAMAYFFEQTKEMSSARQYYLKALALSSNSGAELNNYGAFLCRLGEYQEAEQYFLKAVKDIQYLHTSGAYENAGLCALAIPDYEKAKAYFQAALNQDPSKKESLYELVVLARKEGNRLEAQRLLKKYPTLGSEDKRLLSLAKSIRISSSGVENEYINNNG